MMASSTKRSLPGILDLSGKVVLVTGAGRGIGAGIADRLSEAGAAVVAADVDGASAQNTARRINERGGKAIALGFDVSDQDACEKSVSKIAQQLGPIDVLVNNAGIFPFAGALNVTRELWARVIATNLSGAFFLSQSVAKNLVAAGKAGAIINIASVDAFRPTGGLVPYDSSKAGLVMMTRSLALELAPKKIRVNAVAPGAIQTPGASAATSGLSSSDAEAASKAFLARIPLGRMGTPTDIANAVLFFASEASSYVTGAVLVVDGGYLVA